MKKKILCLLLTFIMMFVLCACPPSDASYRGFIDFEIEKEVYDVDDVTIKLSFGIDQRGIEEIRDVCENVTVFYASTLDANAHNNPWGKSVDFSDPALFLVREITKEDFLSDAYLMQQDRRGQLTFCNHTETITIPREALIEETEPQYSEYTGKYYYTASIFLYLWINRSDRVGLSGYCADRLYYRLEGDKVTLSRKTFYKK